MVAHSTITANLLLKLKFWLFDMFLAVLLAIIVPTTNAVTPAAM